MLYHNKPELPKRVYEVVVSKSEQGYKSELGLTRDMSVTPAPCLANESRSETIMETPPRLKRKQDQEPPPLDLAQSLPKNARIPSAEEVFFGFDPFCVRVPELPVDTIVIILNYWFMSTYRNEREFIRTFLRMFRVCKTFHEELDREYYWKLIVDYIGSGWYHKAINENSDAAKRALNLYESIIPAHAHVDNIFMFYDAAAKKGTEIAKYFCEIDRIIIHKEDPFGDEKDWPVKIGDVSRSKRKVCALLLAYKKPVHARDAVRFLLCMQCIPSAPTKAFRWITEQSMYMDTKVKGIIDEGLADLLRDIVKLLNPKCRTIETWDKIRARLPEINLVVREECRSLEFLQLLVKIFSQEYQPWTNPKYGTIEDQMKLDTKTSSPVEEQASPAPKETQEEKQIDPDQKTVDDAYHLYNMGVIVQNSSKSYSYATRARMAHEQFTLNRLNNVPREKLYATYFNESIRKKSDQTLQWLMYTRHKDASSASYRSIRSLLLDEMGPTSLGIGDTRIKLTPTGKIYSCCFGPYYVTFDLKQQRIINGFDGSRIQAGMYVFFVKHLLKHDPFILFTIAKLSLVSKDFYGVFGRPASPVWALLLRLIGPKVYVMDPTTLTARNEACFAKQLGIDPNTLNDEEQDDQDEDEIPNHVSLTRKMVVREIGHALRTLPLTTECYDPHMRPKILFILRFGLSYQLPRDRLFSFLKASNSCVEFRIALYMIENAAQTALPQFNHCGSIAEYIDKLKRSKADREIEARKIENQLVMNRGLLSFMGELRAMLGENQSAKEDV